MTQQSQVAAKKAQSNSALVSLANEIYQSLGADKTDIDNLNALLAKERATLERSGKESADHKVIVEYAGQKATIVKRMDKRNELRSTLLARHNLASNTEGWKETIKQLDAISPLTVIPMWEEIETQLKDCQTKLMINEKIIGGMKQGVDRFINILRGETGSGQTYNATGKAENFSNSKPFTSA